MSALSPEKLKELMRLSTEQRADYLYEKLHTNQQIWILTDEHGCVMLNTDEEDCVPVWPYKECAEAWATGEWKECKALKLTLKEWQQKWLSGLMEDDLSIAVFPNLEGDSLVLFSDEFEDEFNKVKK